ncbi:RecB family exonuclease [Luteipulveratus flavus]|uniref:PD-(D/E)XK nuclease family protein n=1 Tax=Luteipulveratus flavus TaxID=3031728 RepID=A0ABT6CCL7_9MICO|nr:PD-(D/E)XK nuclease family protein [Luteipulveratus sp. YIM 133296]MDF8265016.1 PD-(D/E)XK nuclease family protein [Luteipulveratus sp. YIM 133296]
MNQPATERSQTELPGMPQRLYAASPSRLTTWLDCPRRYRMQYLDRPSPTIRPQRAHTTVGLVTHTVLRDFWDLEPHQRTPAGVVSLVRDAWTGAGFKDESQSSRWRSRTTQEITDYLRTADRDTQPVARERSMALKTDTLAMTGRVDRMDEREGELVVVDYKTSRRTPTEDDARTSMALAFYAAAGSRMFRKPCVRVELHHVPTGEVVAHEHTSASLERKIGEAESIARDLRRADAAFRDQGQQAPYFAPNPTPLCRWCDFRAHCPEGQAVGPERSSWAALEPDASD